MKPPYFGGKPDANIDVTYSLLPQEKFNKFVDMCTGSGNVTRNISCEMQNIKRVAIEKDPTIFTMHSCIRDMPIQLIEEIRKLKNDEENFNRMKKIVDACLKGEEINEIEVAVATIYTICFSYNNMRSRYRHAKYAHLDFDNVLRQKEELCMQAFESVFYEKIPMIIMDLHNEWKKVQILNDDFSNHMYLLEEEGTVCYLDPPYELHKRGIPKGQKRKNAGYLVDMEQQAHVQMIEKIIQLQNEGKLKASLILCTNYEVDDEKLIIEPDDLYTTLLQYGFRMVVVEVKGSSEVIRKQTVDTTEPKKSRKRKAEVIYINYRDICGNWDDFQFLDEKDVFGR